MQHTNDAYGAFLMDQYKSGKRSSELIERDDWYIDFGSEPGLYFSEYAAWSPGEREVVDLASGRVLDIGCGAGRHSLHLQGRGLQVTGIDDSAGAIRVCRERGARRATVLPIADVDRFKKNSFDTILMLGNNFGLLGTPRRAKRILRILHEITTDQASILAGTRDPYRTSDPVHLAYHARNRKKGRMVGQLKLRARFRNIVGPWFDYLFVSIQEMNEVVARTGWQIERIVDPDAPVYHAVIRKT